MTPEERGNVRAILSANIGFDEPEAWLDYGSVHHFQRVPASRLTRCPDCGSLPGQSVGKFVYYSTLIRLVECEQCALIWADVRLDEGLIQRHFEVVYKDTGYFAKARHAIFRQIAAEVAARTPDGGTVLDVGGAIGELCAVIRDLRPDIRFTLNDLSRSACEVAASRFGIETRCGDLLSLLRDPTRYDTVVCSDVLYYESKVAQMWSALRQLVNARGTLLIRVPNRAWVISAVQRWYRFRANLGDRGNDPAFARVPFFNPEHLYIFRRAYLERRLRANGFGTVTAGPSHPLCSGAVGSAVADLVNRTAIALWRLSDRRAILTPSMLIIAS